MSTPIRPPGGPSIPGIESIDRASEIQPGRLDDVSEVASSTGVAPAQSGEVESPTASVLARLEAGELTREQAVDSLVAQALDAHGGAALPVAQRSELASVLRAALLDDPALGRLLGG